MHFLIRAAWLLAAGAAGWALAKREKKKPEVADAPQVVYLSEEDAVIDAPSAEPEPVAAVVDSCCHRMDPLTLTSSMEATFLIAEGEKIKLHFTGEGGYHLAEGDAGLLTWSGEWLIRFEKENGEVIGGMYYVPAGEDMNDE